MSFQLRAVAGAIVCVLAMAPRAAAADPLTGTWMLNLARTRYGPGAQPRKSETFRCEMRGQMLSCTIRSVRADGRTLTAMFEAAYDGKAYPATGIPDVDQVSLHKIDESVADATFSFKGKPVFGYRAIKSDNGRQLIFVSVDPVTRAALSSVVVYDRQNTQKRRDQQLSRIDSERVGGRDLFDFSESDPRIHRRSGAARRCDVRHCRHELDTRDPLNSRRSVSSEA